MIDKIRSFVWDKDPPVWTKWDLHSRSYISLNDINNVYYCGAQYEANQYDCSLRLENIGVTIPINFASWFLKRFLKNMTKIDSDEKHLNFNWIYLNRNSQYNTKASDKIQKIDQDNNIYYIISSLPQILHHLCCQLFQNHQYLHLCSGIWNDDKSRQRNLSFCQIQF